MAKIIIVEDDLVLANLYKEELTKGGHLATIISDKEAVYQIGAQKPDLVILDILMPNISGLDILRELKIDPFSALIPVILLTNVAEDAAIAKGLELGAYGYLLKSETTPDQILARVNMTLEETMAPKS
ncbi:response regulator transcription factor [Candidatus Curtissbacteria bacterium]|nr:response regulator transcription factor [Candidatus Curtissbacteria bacterium]